MEKYRRVKKTRASDATLDDCEVRITATGMVAQYVAYIGKLMTEQEKRAVVLKAQGTALDKAVKTAEVIKRRIKGLHQICRTGSSDIVDEYEPLEAGLETVSQTRKVSFIEIELSLDELDKNDIGYQPPVPEDQVEESETLTDKPDRKGKGKKGGKKGKGKKGAKGKGGKKGKGKKGKGKKGKKGKSSWDEEEGYEVEAYEEDWGYDSGKGSYDTGKGKGKKGKGKGKKGKKGDKGKDGKGKGKKGEKGKGKKGKGKKGKKSDDWW